MNKTLFFLLYQVSFITDQRPARTDVNGKVNRRKSLDLADNVGIEIN